MGKLIPVTWKRRTLLLRRVHPINQRKFFAHEAWGSRDVIDFVHCDYSQLVGDGGQLKELAMFLNLKGASDLSTFKPLRRLVIKVDRAMVAKNLNAFHPLTIWSALDKIVKIRFLFGRDTLRKLSEDSLWDLARKFTQCQSVKGYKTTITITSARARQFVTLSREPASPTKKDKIAFENLKNSQKMKTSMYRTLKEKLSNGKQRTVDLRICLLRLNHERMKESCEEDRMEVDEAEDVLDDRFNFPVTWECPPQPCDPSPLRTVQRSEDLPVPGSRDRRRMIPIGSARRRSVLHET